MVGNIAKFIMVLISIVTCRAVEADKPSSIPDDVMADLAYFLGSWQAEGTVNGEKSTGTFSAEWAVSPAGDKCGIIGKYCYTTGDQQRTGQDLISWDRVTNRIIDFGFSTRGEYGTLYWTRDSKTDWSGEIVRFENGEKVSGAISLKKLGPSKLVLKREFENGDTAQYTFQRVPPPSLEDACGWLIGDWSGNDDNAMSISWSFRWGPGKEAIISEAKATSANGTEGTGTMSIFPNKRTGNLEYAAVFSNGMYVRATLVESGERSLTWRRICEVDPTGQSKGESSEGTMVFESTDDTLTMKLKDVVTSSGNPSAGFKIAMTRK